MSLSIIFLWICNIVCDACGQLAFKAGASAENDETGLNYWLSVFKNKWILLGIACYLIEFLLWLAFLSLVPLSQGVLLGSINIVVVMVGGRILFKEKLTRLRIAGVLLVTLGVGIVGLYS